MKKFNFFKKISNYGNKDELISMNKKDENIKNSTKSSFLNYIQIDKKEDYELIELQKQFESNTVTFDDMTDEQIFNLESMYERQLTNLKKKLNDKITELNMLKYNYKI